MERKFTTPDGDEVTIRSKPWWLFWLLPGYTITLSPYVYMSEFSLLAKDESSLMNTCVHEAIHLKQQRDSKFKFYFKYVFSRKFRYAAEFEAYVADFRFQISERRKPNVEAVASTLSSIGYLWCCSEAQALEDFRKALMVVE